MKTERIKGKCFNNLGNKIEKRLNEEIESLKIKLNDEKYKNGLLFFKNSYKEYGKNHLEKYFQYDFDASLKKLNNQEKLNFLYLISRYESFFTSVANFENARNHYQLIYELNKGWKKIDLDYNTNPLQSKFHEKLLEDKYGSTKSLNQSSSHSYSFQEIILLSHYLLNQDCPQSEKIRIIEFIISSNHSGNQKISKNFYNQVRLGPKYLGKKESIKNINSLLEKLNSIQFKFIKGELKLDLKKLKK
ncbi:hypothetical protein [Zunongwangia endophytica]|uniref:RteC protein n=1 Tax=Zunongwangia endophytica TaxID=1808945 RepID=A0ABV8HER3_9FLAO|nr:hypothetical protein [Zunongwangia endophytica]MDN3594637.1 hypothetical protein [Zunongwangia endophytica]